MFTHEKELLTTTSKKSELISQLVRERFSLQNEEIKTVVIIGDCVAIHYCYTPNYVYPLGFIRDIKTYARGISCGLDNAHKLM